MNDHNPSLARLIISLGLLYLFYCAFSALWQVYHWWSVPGAIAFYLLVGAANGLPVAQKRKESAVLYQKEWERRN